MILDIHQSFQTMLQNALSIDVKFENLEFSPTLGETFAVFQLGDVTTERQSQGRCGKLNYSGVATLTIKTNIKTGVDEAYQLADTVIQYALDNPFEGGVKLIEPPYVAATEQEFDWLALPVLIPYQKD